MIKVFIEQDCQPGKEAQFRDMLMERRDYSYEATRLYLW